MDERNNVKELQWWWLSYRRTVYPDINLE